MPRLDLTELDPAELEAALTDFGARPFHARQIYRWMYRRSVADFSRMTDLSLKLRARLDKAFVISTPVIAHTQRSADGTVKFLIRLRDNLHVEAVFIPETPAMTFCISTQVGCAMQCGFCLTGKMGLARNLTVGEIVAQVRIMAHALDMADRRFNIVLMGMGEPLHNYDATMKALRILAAASGFAVPPRRVTLSTVGVLPALERLAAEPLMPNLAVSLHATTEEMRDRLVPINRKYGLANLIAACRRFPVKRRRRITFEYVLLDGVNDTVADANRLAKLLQGVRSKVNVIPFNEAPGLPYSRPSDTRVGRFVRTLAEHHVTVSVRKSRGQDIRAACGQLIVEGAHLLPARRMAALLDARDGLHQARVSVMGGVGKARAYKPSVASD